MSVLQNVQLWHTLNGDCVPWENLRKNLASCGLKGDPQAPTGPLGTPGEPHEPFSTGEIMLALPAS
jgi:hypothetical protein